MSQPSAPSCSLRLAGLPRLVLGLMLLQGLAGCSTVAPLPDDHYYRLLAGSAPAQLPAPLIDGLLAVEMPTATGVRNGREILYSEAPYVRFQQYHYHHWEEAPPRLLQHRLVDSLRAAGVARAVTARPRGREGYRLHSHLARFERLIDGERAAAVVELHVRLYALGADDRPLLVADYEERVVAADGAMESSARAFGAAVDAVVRRLLDDLAALDAPGEGRP